MAELKALEKTGKVRELHSIVENSTEISMKRMAARYAAENLDLARKFEKEAKNPKNAGDKEHYLHSAASEREEAKNHQWQAIVDKNTFVEARKAKDTQDGSSVKNSIKTLPPVEQANLEETMTCPITGEIMKDPVRAKLDNGSYTHAYERSAITKWLSNHETDPLTRALVN